MNLFKLYRKDHGNSYYGIDLGFIIRAKDEQIARKIASENSDESNIWLNSELSTCEIITIEGKQEILMNDYKAG